MGPTPEKPEFLQFDFDEPRAAAGAVPETVSGLRPERHRGAVFGRRPDVSSAQARDAANRARQMTIAFDETRAKHFRVVFLSSHPYHDGANWNVQVAEIALLSRTNWRTRNRRRGSGGTAAARWR